MSTLGAWKDEDKRYQGGEEGLGGVKEATGTAREADVSMTRWP